MKEALEHFCKWEEVVGVGRLLHVIGGAVLAFALLSCIGMSTGTEIRIQLGTELIEKSDHFELKSWGLRFDNLVEYIYCVVETECSWRARYIPAWGTYRTGVDCPDSATIEWWSPDGKLYEREEFKLDSLKTNVKVYGHRWKRYSFWSRIAVRGTRAAELLGQWRVTVRVPGVGIKSVVFQLVESEALSAPSANAPPTAGFVWQPLPLAGGRLLVSPRAESRLRFDASSSSDPDGRIVEYAWDWDTDGNYDELHTEPTRDHTFPGPGSYRVALRVTDDQGAIAVAIKTVTVETPPAEAKGPAGELWVLLVGIDTYFRVRPALRFAEADATAFHRLLRDRCRVPEGHIRLLLGKEATLAALREGLEWLFQVAEAGDTVLFYFSGHGAAVQDENGDEEDALDECLVPFDTDPDRLSETTLLDDELAGWVNGLGTNGLVLILDVAHGGGFELPQGVSIAPGGETELAWEKEELGHGVLTYLLLRGLGVEGAPEADLDADGVVTVGEIREYLKQEAPAFLKEPGGQAQEQQVTILGVPGEPALPLH